MSVVGSGTLVDIDVSDRQILITLLIDQPAAHREVFRFLDSEMMIDEFQAVLLNPASNWAGMTPTRVNNFQTGLTVTVTGLAGRAGQQILIDVIPEPATGGLALAGAAGGLAALRRKRDGA